MPRMAFIGVRISWLMLAMNWLFESDAAWAVSVACMSSVMSARKPTVWPSGVRRSIARRTRPSRSRRTTIVSPERCSAMRSATHATGSAALASKMSARRIRCWIRSKVMPGTIRSAWSRKVSR